MKSLDLSGISEHLTQGEAGIWVPTEHGSAVSISFPEAGYDACFDLEDASFWFSHRNEVLSAALELHPFDGPFLDVGGGNGAVSRRLEADGIRTVMLEPGRDGARNARARGLPTVVCATLEQAAFASESFGGAGLFDVIEHVEDDGALLRAVRRVLRPNGVLAVTVPAYAWLWSAEDEAAGHHRRYTSTGLGRVLERAGFAVEYATYFFAPLTLPILLARSLRYRLGRRPSQEVWDEAGRHHTPSRGARTAMELLLGPELRRIRARKTMPFGTSCLALARAK
ncbi:MAG: class I SAM-dependent methyltransferase [Labilithrix sp.]|nr:class I SAM-dependent methyltransferase [Labilithrix sp.]MBX3220851.1 class I SAM-dependent methyltransferase [Labilithrix sp.]